MIIKCLWKTLNSSPKSHFSCANAYCIWCKCAYRTSWTCLHVGNALSKADHGFWKHFHILIKMWQIQSAWGYNFKPVGESHFLECFAYARWESWDKSGFFSLFACHVSPSNTQNQGLYEHLHIKKCNIKSI